MNQFSNENSALIEQTVDKETIKSHETLFTLSNGHIGIRGSLEESDLDWDYAENIGTYVNGYFEKAPIQYGEWAYGYAKNHQTICKLPNSHLISFSIDGEWFNLGTGTTTNHQRTLDLQQGLLIRTFTWESSNGKKVDARIERLVSYDFPELLLVSYQLTPLNFDGEIVFQNKVQRTLKEMADSDDPRVASGHGKQIATKAVDTKGLPMMLVSTLNSHLHIWCTAKAIVGMGRTTKQETILQDEAIMTTTAFEAKAGQPNQLVVVAGYGDKFNEESKKEHFAEKLEQVIQEASRLGYEEIKHMHISNMANFWRGSDVQLAGDDQLQLGLRFNLFHLNQAAGRDGLTNIAAKGLTGDGYEGHYFWDTEMYMLPFFIYTQPNVARQLLSYRHSILPKARERARDLGVEQGALYAWRTIDGEECSAYYPAGTAQFHINADIAHGVKVYYEATQDDDFMRKHGLDILIETARFWVTFGDFIPEKGNQFCLNGVTGPDEYTAVVNNNYYTNLMAKHNLLFAANMVNHYQEDLAFKGLSKRLNFDLQEVEKWQEAGNQMYLPYDEERKLTKQDDSFFDKAVWDFENTPREKYPLLLHYHPLTIYRYQVNKQADTVLAAFLYGEDFALEQKKRDYHYYEKITTHDSSLSHSVFGMMASEIGEKEKAYKYFMNTALMDLNDMQKNTKDGIHAANMGGTWMSLIYGFAGMKVVNNQLGFSPRIPEQWGKLSFQVYFHNQLIRIEMTHDVTEYRLLEGESLELVHQGGKLLLNTNHLVIIEN